MFATQVTSRVAGSLSSTPFTWISALPGPPSPSTTRPMAAAVNVSPGRTKRGSTGCTITGSRTAISEVPIPKRSGPETALARIMKLVRLSGSSTVTVTVPSGPTSIAGL